MNIPSPINKWLPNVSFQSDRLTLFCFPYAGGGASAYREWQKECSQQIQICPLQLPGRENRFHEKCTQHLENLVSRMADELELCFQGQFVFFGHSVGGLVAFELVRELRRRKRALPVYLFVSARHAPHWPLSKSPIYNLPDEKLLEKLRQYHGTPERFFRDKELQDLYLPILRADFALVETYTYYKEDPLPLPIAALGGKQDDTLNQDGLQAWEKHTTEMFSVHWFPGGHFYLNQPNTRTTLLNTIKLLVMQ